MNPIRLRNPHSFLPKGGSFPVCTCQQEPGTLKWVWPEPKEWPALVAIVCLSTWENWKTKSFLRPKDSHEVYKTMLMLPKLALAFKRDSLQIHNRSHTPILISKHTPLPSPLALYQCLTRRKIPELVVSFHLTRPESWYLSTQSAREIGGISKNDE